MLCTPAFLGSVAPSQAIVIAVKFSRRPRPPLPSVCIERDEWFPSHGDEGELGRRRLRWIRSIVWIGDERLAVELAADCPTLERPSSPPFFFWRRAAALK